MNLKTEGIQNFDIIVFGPNITSLISAGLLSKKQKVLYIEENNFYNYIGTGSQNLDFPICSYYFDLRSGIAKKVIDELSLSDFQPVEHKYLDRIYLKDIVLDRLTHWKNYTLQLEKLFPQDSVNIEFLYELFNNLAQEWNLIINQKVKGNWRLLKNTIKYRNIKYRDFIKDIINDSLLVELLMVDVPYSDISLSVMAGFTLQIFESSYFPGDFKKFVEKLKKIIIQNDSMVLESKQHIEKIDEYRYLVNGIMCSGKNIILNQYKKNNTANYNKRISSFLINIELFLKNKKIDFNIAKVFIKDNFIQSLEQAEANSIRTAFCYQIQRPLKQNNEVNSYFIQVEIMVDHLSGENDLKRIKNEVLCDIGKRFELKKNSIKKMEVINLEQMEKRSGFYHGIHCSWAFSPEEIKENPLRLNKKKNNIYYANNWGKSFFAYGKLIANIINNESNKIENLLLK